MLLHNGYVTGMAASTPHMFKSTQNFIRGMSAWDFIRGHEADPWKMRPVSSVDVWRYALPETNRGGSLGVIVQFLLNNRDRKGPEDYIDARLFSRAVRFVEDNRDNQPFFLWVDSFSPHWPWDPPREYADAYAPDWDDDWLPIVCFNPDVSDKIKRRVIAQYYGHVTYVDEQIGTILANDVQALLEGIEYRREVALSSKSQTISLPYRQYTEADITGTARGSQRNPAIYDRCIPSLLERIRERGTQPAEVQVTCIDEHAYVAIPAEYFAESGLRIKERVWPRRGLVVSCANGMVGYAPTREALERGGYEPTFGPTSHLAPEAGDMLADAAVDLVRS